MKGMAWRPDGKVIAIGYSNSRCQRSVYFCGVEVSCVIYSEGHTVMHCIMSFWSMMDRIYDGGPVRF